MCWEAGCRNALKDLFLIYQNVLARINVVHIYLFFISFHCITRWERGKQDRSAVMRRHSLFRLRHMTRGGRAAAPVLTNAPSEIFMWGRANRWPTRPRANPGEKCPEKCDTSGWLWREEVVEGWESCCWWGKLATLSAAVASLGKNLMKKFSSLSHIGWMWTTVTLQA